ncbi:unnamed protein product [Peniophora sp. CBMAI 1063]|nr:unnamed protein product [Peniophora sp. CBMAI 1063]
MASKGQGNKTVLITGCTTGSIGHALSLEFQRQGFNVIATSRNLATMQDLVQHKLIEAVRLDVCSEVSIAAAVKEVAQLTGGRLDYLVNNAGGDASPAPATEVDIERAKQIFDLNFWGAVCVIKAFTPLLIRSRSGGRIINISSAAGTLPIPYLSMYGASKAALNHYSDVLRAELVPFNISVTIVVTGAIANSKNKGQGEDFVLRIEPDSLYAWASQIHARAHAKSVETRMTAQEYARQLVHHATQRRPKKCLYIGHQTFFAWLMEAYFPRWLTLSIMIKLWGLGPVATQHDS